MNVSFSRQHGHRWLVAILSFLLFAVPFVAFGAFNSVQDVLVGVITFLRTIVLPLIFSIAFLYFIINLARYFIIEGANEAAHAEARTQAIYGIAAFVLFFALWGIVNMVVIGLNIGGQSPSCPDYISAFGGTCSPGQTGGTFSGGSFGSVQVGGSGSTNTGGSTIAPGMPQ